MCDVFAKFLLPTKYYDKVLTGQPLFNGSIEYIVRYEKDVILGRYFAFISETIRLIWWSRFSLGSSCYLK